MKEKYIVNDNIDVSQIKEFIDDYNAVLISGKINNQYIIEIYFDNNDQLDKGQVDPLFLSYIALFLLDSPKSQITFNIQNLDSESYFPLITQLEYFAEIFKLKERIKVSGTYIDKYTGEVKEIKLRKNLTHSQKFIPPLYIHSLESIDFFFNKNLINDNPLKDLIDEYKKKIIEIIAKKGFNTTERNNKNTINLFIENQIQIDSMSFIEITLYLLLINTDSFHKLSGSGITQERKNEIFKIHKEKFTNYAYYVKELSRGLKELAKNIYEHSSDKKGVITARIFRKEIISNLKGEKSIENKYFSENSKDYYLDINVIDFGNETIKSKYRLNLERHKNVITELGIDQEELENDINIINNFELKDFFIINEQFFQLKHQQNKLISRYGLHHFTSIIKDRLKGFIKVSSQGEGIVIYKNNDILNNNNFENIFFPSRGTTYNCIIPIEKDFINNKISEIEDFSNEVNVNSINAVSEIIDYKIYPLSERNGKFDKKPLLLFPSNKEEINIIKKEFTNHKDDKYGFLFFLYNKIVELGKENTNEILLLNAIHLKVTDASEWTKLLSALNSKFKDIIVYNTNKDNIKVIKDIRNDYEKSFTKIKERNNSIENFSFWSYDSRVLFYSRKEADIGRDRKYYRFGATALMGTSIKEYNFINKSIWRHHYSFSESEGFFVNIENELKEPPKRIYGNKLFVDKKLKYFDLLIKADDNLSLFEKSVQYSLNKEYSRNNKHSNNRGYKISNTHFRLGSKIHISDFYYAKRLFQNSFFTYPLSFIITKYILSVLDEKIKYLSIIGYENYSDFISSSVRNLLHKIKPEFKVNNFIITKDGELSREYKKLYSNTIILVPIATTLSTSIKIKKDIDRIITLNNFDILKKLKRKYSKIKKKSTKDAEETSFIKIIDDLIKKFNIDFNKDSLKEEDAKLIPELISRNNSISRDITKNYKDKQNVIARLNILLVGPKEEKSNKYFDDNDINLKEFSNKILDTINWQSIDITKKIITTKDFLNQDESLQKYFIPLYSTWHKAEDCKLCFPDKSDNILSEKCLIETGKASITPKIIFDFPKVKKGIYNNRTLSYKESLLFGNLKRIKNRYLFFLKTGTILNQSNNKNDIIKWLKEVKEKLKNDISNKKIVLVTQSSNTKSNFINLVNEYIFDYTANIVIVSLDENYIENSESLYSDALYKAEKVFYVDDLLLTNRSFFKVNNIVKYIRNQNNEGVNYCISLINRMPYNIEKNLLIELNNDKNLFYFTKLNVPSIEEPNTSFPLEIERKRYKFLSGISSLDAIRTRFNAKRENLKVVNINNLSDLDEERYNKINDKVGYKNRKLFQLLVIDAFYTLFEYDENGNYIHKKKIDSFNAIAESNDNEKIKSEFEKIVTEVKRKLSADKKNNSVIIKYLPNLDCVILKIICGTPLIYYKNIKETAYKVILVKLTELINEIKNINNKNNSNVEKLFLKEDNKYSKIETLKFLLKKSVRLQSNFIISDTFFRTLQKIILLINSFKEPKQQKAKKELYQMNLFSQGKIITNLTNTYFKITAKEFIYYVISLIQELIYEHEIKSIKLKKVIDKYREQTIDNNIENGNFEHFLRLLNLENTELFYKFYKYYTIDKTKYTPHKELSNYDKDPKYEIAEKLIDKENNKGLIIKYVELSDSLLSDNVINKNNNGGLKKLIEETILKNITDIIGEDEDNVVEAYFTVNYNNLKKNISENDLYVFRYGKTNNLLRKEELKDSLTYKIFSKGITTTNMYGKEVNDNVFTDISNLEIIKNTNEITFRNNLSIINNVENNYNEFKNIKNENQYNILFIRISNFYKETSKSKKNKLYTQGVLTIYLKKGERLDEDKLRMILLLRKSLSKFLTKQLTSVALNELLKYEEREKILSLNKHYLEPLLYNLKHLYNKTESKKGDKLLYDIIFNAIYNKTIRYRKENIIFSKKYTLSELEEYIKTIFKESIFGGKEINPRLFNIRINSVNSTFTLPVIIVNNVLLQLLINIKQYTDTSFMIDDSTKPIIDINIKATSKQFLIELTNKVDKIAVRSREKNIRKPEGNKLIKEIISLINKSKKNYISFEKPKKCDINDHYCVKLTVKLN